METLGKALKGRIGWQWVITLGLYVFFTWFYLFTNDMVSPEYTIHSVLDDYIPYVNDFVYIYLSWFFMLAWGAVYMTWFCRDSEKTWSQYRRHMICLFGGWAICIAIFWLWPTKIDFRPEELYYGTSTQWHTAVLFNSDEPYNVMPSLHCYSTMAIMYGICTYEPARRGYFHRIAMVLWGVGIIASTVLMKQHSILDMFAAAAIFAVMWCVSYLPGRQKK